MNISKVIVKIEKDFTVIPNEIIRNKEMSMNSKMLLITMLSLPPDWDFSINGLKSIVKEGRDTVRNALQEIEKYGYLTRNRVRNDNGTLVGYEYTVYQYPVEKSKRTYKNKSDKPKTEKPTSVKPTSDKPSTDFQIQYNTDIKLNKDNIFRKEFELIIDDNKKDAFELSNDSMDALKPNGYKEMASKYNNKNDYSEEELTTYISHVIDSIMENEYMISANEKMCVELKRIIFYFYSEYNRIFQDKHPILSDISYGNIVDRYMNPSGRNMSNDEVKDFDTYKKMIDRYFATDFGKYKGTPENFNYRISHFMSDAIRENLYMKVI